MTNTSAPMTTLRQLLAWLPGGVAAGDLATPVTRVHSDTRSLQNGDLFVALQGEHYDGNRFLAQARDSGAVAAVCHPGAGLAQAGLPGIEVPDTRKALGLIASAWRAQFDLPLIAVTGSNGKTTVTQMLASVLRAWKPDAMLATQGNFNNDIGVPLTLLRLRKKHRIAVLELGMNHPGEIAAIAAMAQPGIALVNNAQREHLEFMATVQAVAQENGSVISALPDTGTAVFPYGDAFADVWRTLAGTRRQLTFAMAPIALDARTPTAAADVVCTQAHWSGAAWSVQVSTPVGALQFALPIAGLHNVHNALAAITCAHAADIPLADIARGLEAFEPVKGRSRALPLTIRRHPVTLVDDSYNANPDSVQAALDLLASLPGPRLMVLGDMGEVGDQGAVFHAQAGEHARALGIELLFTLGDLSAASSREHGAARHFADMPALIQAVQAELPGIASVLVKGSRFMQMERVVQAISERAQQDREEANAA